MGLTQGACFSPATAVKAVGKALQESGPTTVTNQGGLTPGGCRSLATPNHGGSKVGLPVSQTDRRETVYWHGQFILYNMQNCSFQTSLNSFWDHYIQKSSKKGEGRPCSVWGFGFAFVGRCV